MSAKHKCNILPHKYNKSDPDHSNDLSTRFSSYKNGFTFIPSSIIEVLNLQWIWYLENIKLKEHPRNIHEVTTITQM